MAIVSERANDALTVNPPAGDQYLSVNGSNWLYAVTAVFLLSFLIVLAMGYKARMGEKIFHYIFAIAFFVAGISYFTYASDLAWVVGRTSNNTQNGATAQMFWVKYVNWVVQFPAAILVLGLISGVAWATIVYNIALSWIWILSYLSGALTATSYKWAFFAFGTFANFTLTASLVIEGGRGSKRLGTASHHLTISFFTFLWPLYSLAWALTDGGNVISATGATIWNGILDVVFLVGVAFTTLFFSRYWDYSRLGLYFTQHGRVPGTPETHSENGTRGSHRGSPKRTPATQASAVQAETV